MFDRARISWNHWRRGRQCIPRAATCLLHRTDWQINLSELQVEVTLFWFSCADFTNGVTFGRSCCDTWGAHIGRCTSDAQVCHARTIQRCFIRALPRNSEGVIYESLVSQSILEWYDGINYEQNTDPEKQFDWGYLKIFLSGNFFLESAADSAYWITVRLSLWINGKI